MRVDWCVSSWFRIKNTHSHTHRKSTFAIQQDNQIGVLAHREGGAEVSVNGAISGPGLCVFARPRAALIGRPLLLREL